MTETMSGDRRPLLIAVSAVMMVLAFIAVLLRFVCRWTTQAARMSDDWLILVALVRLLLELSKRDSDVWIAFHLDTSYYGDMEYEGYNSNDQMIPLLTHPSGQRLPLRATCFATCTRGPSRLLSGAIHLSGKPSSLCNDYG